MLITNVNLIPPVISVFIIPFVFGSILTELRVLLTSLSYVCKEPHYTLTCTIKFLLYWFHPIPTSLLTQTTTLERPGDLSNKEEPPECVLGWSVIRRYVRTYSKEYLCLRGSILCYKVNNGHRLRQLGMDYRSYIRRKPLSTLINNSDYLDNEDQDLLILTFVQDKGGKDTLDVIVFVP